MGEIRQFESGATRDTDQGKLDFEGFLHPLCVEAFAEYMNRHRIQSDGSFRDSDNWQKGIPKDALMKSGWRHFFSWWKAHRGYATQEPTKDSLCALIFNAQGYLLEVIRAEEARVDCGAGAQFCHDVTYECGCSASGLGPLPDYCPDHPPLSVCGQAPADKPLTAWEKLQRLALNITGAL